MPLLFWVLLAIGLLALVIVGFGLAKHFALLDKEQDLYDCKVSWAKLYTFKTDYSYPGNLLPPAKLILTLGDIIIHIFFTCVLLILVMIQVTGRILSLPFVNLVKENKD